MSYEFNEFQLEWLEALDSGGYKQHLAELYDQESKGFCCLGIACMLHSSVVLEPHEWDVTLEQTLSPDTYRGVNDDLKLKSTTGVIALNKYNITQFLEFLNTLETTVALLESYRERVLGIEGSGVDLTLLNDDGVSFKDIAKICRKFPELIFN